MGRAVLLGPCPSSLHKAEVWVCSLGFRYGLVHLLFPAPSTFSMGLLLGFSLIEHVKLVNNMIQVIIFNGNILNEESKYDVLYNT